MPNRPHVDNPSILISGAAGFIGSNFVHWLVDNTAAKIVGFDKLTYAGVPRSLLAPRNSAQFQLVEGDIGDTQLVSKILASTRPDCIFHLAAESHVDRSIDTPDEFLETNVVGTHRLLAATFHYWRQLDEQRKSRFVFIHVSTDEVYGSLSADAPPFSETSPYAPRSPYAASKAAADHFARAWQTTYQLPVIITNCSNNYGPYQFPEKLIPVVILQAIAGKPIPVYGSGENVRDWIHVDDHVAGLWSTFLHGEPGQSYHFGGGVERTNLDLIGQVCQLLDTLVPPSQNARLTPEQRKTISSYSQLITYVADRPGHDFRYAMDTTKSLTDLGWRPETEFETGLRKTVIWYLTNGDWLQAIFDGGYRLQRQGLTGPSHRHDSTP